MNEGTIAEGQILTGVMFNEPMRVVTTRRSGGGAVIAGTVGQNSGQFREVTLTQDDIANLNAIDPNPSYDGDGELLNLALQAYSLGIAHEFDPYFGLSISRVGPLPHQLEAILDSAKTYLTRLGVDFPAQDSDWQVINNYAGIRNKLMHAGGLLSEGGELTEYALRKQIVSDRNGRELVLTRSFCEEAVNNLEGQRRTPQQLTAQAQGTNIQPIRSTGAPT